MLFNGCDNNRILTKFKDRKSTLVHGFTQRNYTFQLNIGRKKIGVNKTANSESVLKIGHLSKMNGHLTFQVNGKPEWKVGRQLLKPSFSLPKDVLYFLQSNLFK